MVISSYMNNGPLKQAYITYVEGQCLYFHVNSLHLLGKMISIYLCNMRICNNVKLVYNGDHHVCSC